MDNNHIILIALLVLSEVMGALPEKYLWVNGFLDMVCKALKETLKKPNKCQQNDIEMIEA